MSKKVLLIADDDQMNRKIINRFLKEDFMIVEAEDGKVALDVIKSQKIDVVLLDIIMPHMDGLEVLDALNKEEQDYSEIGILVATSAKEKTERIALGLGADDVVSKPYDPIVIKKRLENILDVKEMHKQRKKLLNDDIEGLLDNKLADTKAATLPILDHIRKSTKLINGNKENYKLIDELTQDINNSVNQIQNILDNK